MCVYAVVMWERKRDREIDGWPDGWLGDDCFREMKLTRLIGNWK